jgi:transcriptional antiterminator RfaH
MDAAGNHPEKNGSICQLIERGKKRNEINRWRARRLARHDTNMTIHWYVLRSKPRKEEFLTDQLLLRKIETFNPRIRVHTVNPRARKVRSYFPGYVFLHHDLDKEGASSMQFIPGSVGLLRFGGEAANVPDGLIHAIQKRVEEINDAGGELFETLKIGETVLIHSGPFAGYEAIFNARLPGSERVRVLLKFLKEKRLLPVELPVGSIRPKNNPG